MRIALIALHFAEYAFKLASALALEHQVLLIVERRNFETELGAVASIDRPSKLKVCFVEHRRSIWSVLSNVSLIRSTILSFQPNVVHLQEAIWDYQILALPFLKKYPLFLTIHDPEPHSGEQHYSGLQKRYGLYRRLLRRACDAAIAHGDFLLAEVERLYPRLRGRVYAIPHGPLGEIDSSLNTGCVPGDLLFFGRIQAYKGLAYFVKAVERLGASGRKVRGIIAGRGAELDAYRDRIAASGLFEVQEGFIPREQVPALFHRAQVVVLPYTDGTQSGVAALAMGFGRPVVASRVGSIPELVLDGETGLLAEARNVDDLVGKLARLIDEPQLSESMGTKGLRRCHRELSWESIARMTTRAYKTTRNNMLSGNKSKPNLKREA